MKFRFSRTAVAMLMALGLTACGSSGGGNGSSPTKPKISTPSAQTHPQPSTQGQSQNNSQSSSQVPSSAQSNVQNTNNSDNSWRKQYISLGDLTSAELMWDKKTYRGGSHYGVYPSKTNEVIDYDKLSGGKQGYFTGSFKPAGKSTANIDSVNYAFINQPYSTYGMVFNNNPSEPAMLMGVVRDSTSPTQLMGTATYKGQVIGSLSEGGHYSTPKLDGTADITVKFNGDRATMSGELNTHLVGKIVLPEIKSLPREENGIFQFSTASNGKLVTEVEKFSNVLSGHYSGVIGGENASDITGTVSVVEGGSNSKFYIGSFGGTKQ